MLPYIDTYSFTPNFDNYSGGSRVPEKMLHVKFKYCSHFERQIRSFTNVKFVSKKGADPL
jgi:hypothetical protein